MASSFEEEEEAFRRDDRRLRADEKVELQGRTGEEIAVEDDADHSPRVADDGEGSDGAGGDSELFLEPRGAREAESAGAEGIGEPLQVERLLLPEDDEPGGSAPLLEEEVLAVAALDVRRGGLRLGDGEDRLVVVGPHLDAECGEEGEEADRVERSVLRDVGEHGGAILNPAARAAYNSSAGGSDMAEVCGGAERGLEESARRGLGALGRFPASRAATRQAGAA